MSEISFQLLHTVDEGDENIVGSGLALVKLVSSHEVSVNMSSEPHI